MESLEDDQVSSSPIASFYKLILKPRLDLQKLGIPRKFMITHGNDLSNTIYLKTPTDKIWKFKLAREDEKAFLQKGWPEFVEYYSLKHGHFLMFHYQGNSHFEVIICDTSASEIMYPLLDDHGYKGRPLKKHKQTHHCLISKPSSSKKANNEMQIVVDDKLVIATIKRSNCLTRDEDKRIRAYAACQCNHPSFATKIQPSYVKTKFYLGIPLMFAKKYLHKEPPFECNYYLITDDDNGGKWPVKIVGEESHVRVVSGWKDFASEYKVKVGDICIFELISGKQCIKVHLRCT